MNIINKIQYIGEKVILLIINIGKACFILKHAISGNFNIRKNIKQIIKQMYFVGVLSLGIIIISGFFIGMVVGLQGYNILKKFGAEQLLGQMVVLTITRELGPVVSALLFAGRTGASLTAEIGLMKITEQLISMEMMGIDPLKKIITPRLISGIISMTLLSLIFIAASIIGSYITIVKWLNIDSNIFWCSIQDTINFKNDIMNSLIKSLIFGFTITWISLFQGINCKFTAEGIGIATTKTVVYSSFAILSINFFLTAIMYTWK